MKSKSIAYDAIIYLIVLLLGCVSGGMLLAAYQANQFIWLGNSIVTLRLAQTGSSSISLAIAWLSMWFWASVLIWVKPYKLTSNDGPTVALWLLLSWTIAISIVFLLGFANRRMSKLGLNQRQSTYGLILIVWGAMILGWCIYQWL